MGSNLPSSSCEGRGVRVEGTSPGEPLGDAHATTRDRCGHATAVPWLLVALFLIQVLIAFRPDALAWDGVFYYSYARSVVLDGDLELGNDISLSYDITPGQDFVSQDFHTVKTPTGSTANPFAPGTAFLWLPWYAPGAAIVRLGRALAGAPGALNGYELALRWDMGAVTAVYGFAAVLVSHRLAERQTSRWSGLVASAVAMFATPLLYYQFREPFYAHAASALVVALFVAAWWNVADGLPPGAGSGFFLGALGGMAALVRTQNAAYLVLPLMTAMACGWTALRRRDSEAMRRALTWLALVGAGAMVALSVQVALWRVLYGEWIVMPQGAGFMDWRAPWLVPVLCSTFRGLVPWMPIVIPGIAGLVVLARRRPYVAVPLLVAFGLQVYINASVNDWFAGGGYGPRRFSSTLVILLVGVAVLIDLRREITYRCTAIAAGAALGIHQWLLVSRGFADGAGGRLIRMSAPPEWIDEAAGAFLRQLMGYLPDVARNPATFLILPDSPLAIAPARPAAAAAQVALIVAVLGITYGIAVLTSYARRRNPKARSGWLAPAAIVAVVVLVDAWVLLAA